MWHPVGMNAAARAAAAAQSVRRAERNLATARAALHAAVLLALGAGVTQAELVKLTGYSRERLRQLARQAEAREA